MIDDLVSLNIKSDLLTESDFVPSAIERKPVFEDITDRFYSRLFRPIPRSKTGQIVFTSSLLIGWQGSGKSDTIAYDMWRCLQTYGEENVQIIHTNSYRTVLNSISGKRPVVFAVVDDAMRCQNSRKSMSSESADLVADYNETRHVFEKRSAGMVKNAVIIVETAVQRWHGLDITIRSSSELIRFKTGESDRKDRDTIRDYLGPEGVIQLDRIWNAAIANPRFKSMSVARIANEQPPMGVGFCWNGYMPDVDPEFVMPPLVESDTEGTTEETIPQWTAEDPLSDLRRDPRWSYKISAYAMAERGMKQADIVEALSVSYDVKAARSTVSTWISDVRRVLSERTVMTEGLT